MKAAIGLAALAVVSLALTALRYVPAADADDRFQAGLAARLARADVLVGAIEALPALRVLHLRRIGCEGGWRLAFAPDDGEATHALAHLMPGATVLRAASDTALRPGWIVLVGIGPDACLHADAVSAILRDTNG